MVRRASSDLGLRMFKLMVVATAWVVRIVTAPIRVVVWLFWKA